MVVIVVQSMVLEWTNIMVVEPAASSSVELAVKFNADLSQWLLAQWVQ